MKKRLISILLTVLMVMSLFTGMSVSAYADETDNSNLYVEYTLVAGDTVLRICQRNGINFYTCREAIMALNNITSDNGFRFLSVGQVIKIPVSDAAAIAIMQGTSSSSGSTAGTGTSSTTVASSDTIAYYLIPYTMQRGETVLGVCNAMGISFADYADQIMKINNISSWSKVKAGDTVLLPSKTTPAVGTTCYAVVAHKIASGETAYTICQKNGVNYGSSTKLLQALNNSSNLANVKAGQNFYLPVVTTIKAASTSTSTGSTNTGNTNTTTGTGTTTGSTNTTTGNTAAATYDLTANINTAYGTMSFYVNNESVTRAAAGSTVTVDVTTNDGRAVESLVVKYSDGRADVKMDGNSFVMPACDVRVDANIKSGYDITINSNYSYKTAATVGGVSVSSAAKGSSVKIVSTDPSYAVDTIKVYYSTLLGIKRTVTVNDANCFVMPAKDVTVDVTLAPVTTYNFYREDCVNGGFDLKVDGNSVSKAAKGAKVTVVWEAASGYDIGFINVTNRSTGKSINVFNNSFTMPASDVTVEVGFINNTNAIDIEAVEGGLLRAYDADGNRITEAETGDTVYVKAESLEEGYTNDYEITVIRKADGHYVSVNNTDKSFRMPAGGVTITGTIKGAETNAVTVSFNASGSENSVTLKSGTTEWTVNDNQSGSSQSFAVGSKISLSTLARDSHAFTKFNVYVGGVFDQEATDMANEQGLFYMPNAAVGIEAIFSADSISIGYAEITGNGTVSYQVNGNTAHSCKVGDTVEIVAVSADAGRTVTEENIQVINKATGKELKVVDTDNDGYFEFQMPAEGVTIKVSFVGKEHVVTMKTVDNTSGIADKNHLNGKSMWALYVNGYEPNVENTTAGSQVDVRSGDALMLFQTDASIDKYVIEKIEILGSDGKTYSGGLEYNNDTGRYAFWMVDDDITVTVYLKEKTNKTISLANVSWDVNKGSVGSTIGSYTNPVVSTAQVGDVVCIVPQALDPYFVEADSLTITRNSDGGAYTMGNEGDPVVDGKFYPVTSNGKVVAWQYKMPEGGVTAHVEFKSAKFQIKLNVVDTNGKSTDSKGVALNNAGYLTVVATDTNTLYEVSNGQIENVAYGSAVKVMLSHTGESLYAIDSVTASGVSINSINTFWMPANDIELNVTLRELNPVPETVEFTYSTNNLAYGKLEFYANDALTELLDDEAEVGKTVYIKALCEEGYKVKEISVINKLDKTELVEKAGEDYKFVMPADGVTIKVTFEAIEYTLTIDCAAADENRVQVRVGTGSAHVVKKGDTITVPYNSLVTFSMYDTNYTLSSVATTVNGVTKVITANGVQATVTMPASDMSVDFTLK